MKAKGLEDILKGCSKVVQLRGKAKSFRMNAMRSIALTEWQWVWKEKCLQRNKSFRMREIEKCTRNGAMTKCQKAMESNVLIAISIPDKLSTSLASNMLLQF